MRGVFLDSATVDRHDLDLEALKSSLPVWSMYETTPVGEVENRIREADIVISNKVRLDRETLECATSLKLVCVAATGTNNIDLEAAAEHNIIVCNAVGYATTSVVEHVFSLILALTRHLRDYQNAVKEGKWHAAETFCLLDYPFRELADLTLGIIGYGELGRATAVMGKAFGMNVVVAQRRGSLPQSGRIPLEQLLSVADVISLHCPLTSTTRNLIDQGEFSLMKKDALLINTARGGIVNETALRRALQSGQIAGAATDVLSEEPPRQGNPLLDEPVPNLIITPHIAWAGINARQSLINELTENIHAFLKGSPRNVVHA
ncbi:MAG: 2-hydroxyacid dehydrogenase [Gammaproteobacteria bacterium]|jgi:glycerate dehydrogenase|nr:2-hydroxyacid dehydrogenase [Gammaproteobacteria bacterium]